MSASRLSEDSRNQTYSHVGRVGLGANLTDQRDGGGLSERGDGLLGELLGEGVLTLIEALVKDNRGLSNTLSLGQSGITGGTEKEVVAEAVGGSGESLVGRLVVGSKVTDQDDLVSGLEVLNGGLVDDGNGGQGLLGHV
jgi:hypothetical protein